MVITKDGSRYQFKEIIREDSSLFAVKKIRGINYKLDLSGYDIKTIKYFNLPLTLLIIVPPLTVFSFIAVKDMNFGTITL